MRKWMIAVLLLTIPCLMWGCRKEDGTPKKEPAPDVRLVESIDVTLDPADEELDRHYSTQEKLDKVLSYLRGLELSADVEGDPETSEETQYRITVHYVGGGSRTYIQIANLYFQEEGQAWEQLPGSDNKIVDLNVLLRRYDVDNHKEQCNYQNDRPNNN